ncbi:imidazolonepropionase-like domain-containing protein [Streptomyces flavalbus]|uniref:Aminodeoxyfutalosine deaminase/Imidazolonepropionase-like composite domain-containing protein n=1 Tax=Streptomyces flavalbus TaxID=2665155 RepID=A0ABW2WAW2_9ACTN
MLTIHAADLVVGGAEELPDGAVAVDGARIAAVGTLTELTARFPGARVRRWPGVLGPGLVYDGPLPDAPSPRERVHAVLKRGATAVLAGHAETAELRGAAERNDVRVVADGASALGALAAGGRADLAVFAGEYGVGEAVATVCAGRLVHRRR